MNSPTPTLTPASESLGCGFKGVSRKASSRLRQKGCFLEEGVRSREQIDQELGESSRQMECVCVLVFIVSLIQPRTTWEERASTEELLKSDWPVDKSVWNCLD